MNRRRLLRILGKSTLLLPFLARYARAAIGTRDERLDGLVLLQTETATGSAELLKLVGQTLGFSEPSWQNEIRRLSAFTDRQAINHIVKRYGFATTVVQYPTLLRLPKISKSGTAISDVEIWTEQWSAFLNEKLLTACYPVSSGWWSVEGDWYPTREKVRDHLFLSSNHSGGEFLWEWLELLRLEELQSVHSDHHWEMTNRGAVSWNHVNGECPA